MDEVIERIKAHFSTIYLTLISVIQASVLSYAMVCTDGLLHGLTARTAILLTTTFLIIVLNWNEYVMGSTTFRWVPTVVDSFLPFLIGASEFLMVRSLTRDGAGWYFWLAAFCLLGCAGFINQYREARRLPDNDALFAALGRWTQSSEIMLLVISVLAVAIGFVDNSLPAGSPARTSLAVAALAGTFAYLVRTVFYWRRITRHAPARRG